MTAAPPTADAVRHAPRWGMGDALVGWLFAYISAALLGALILAAFGYTGDEVTPDNLPLSMIALQYPPLWLGFVGVSFIAPAISPTITIGATTRKMTRPASTPATVIRNCFKGSRSTAPARSGRFGA